MKITSKAKTMSEAKEEVFQYVCSDRDWKGASVLMEIKDENSAKGFHGSTYSIVVEEERLGHLYLCIGHFSTKATARKMTEDLRSGKITLAQAIEKSLKAFERWVESVVTGKMKSGSNGIAYNQLQYFGGTKEQLQRLVDAEKKFSDYVTRSIEERKQRTA
jgi:hypothetical protein